MSKRIWWRDVCDRLPGGEEPKVRKYHDRATGATAWCVHFDPLFSASTGGLQLRWTDEELISTAFGAQFALESAGCGSIKCWLRDLRICGGKVMVFCPPSLRGEKGMLSDLLYRVGKAFKEVPFWAKPDVGTGKHPDYLEAYAAGGGKLAGGVRSLRELGLRTATSVVAGLTEVLRLRHNRAIKDADVVILGANGRLGLLMLELFHQARPRRLVIADCDSDIQHLGEQFGADVLTLEKAQVCPADILCSGGPPRHFTAEMMEDLQALVVGGPANDLMYTPEIYGLRPTEVAAIPGGALTAASMYDPRSEFSELSSLAEVAAHSARLQGELMELAARTAQSIFDAMVDVAMLHRTSM